jgi:hypothetical protein
LALDDAFRSIGPLASPLLVLLLSIDCAFLLLHVLNGWSTSPNALLSVGTDRGYAERFQYIKECSIALMLLAVAWRTRGVIYVAWALLFAYLLFDDALRLHERAGQRLVIYWDIVPVLGLDARNLGEHAVSLTVGSAFVATMAFCYFRSSNDARRVSRNLILLLAILVLFGILVDMVPYAIKTLAPLGLMMIEDGGEMVAMSVIVNYVAHLRRCPTACLLDARRNPSEPHCRSQ